MFRSGRHISYIFIKFLSGTEKSLIPCHENQTRFFQFCARGKHSWGLQTKVQIAFAKKKIKKIDLALLWWFSFFFFFQEHATIPRTMIAVLQTAWWKAALTLLTSGRFQVNHVSPPQSLQLRQHHSLPRALFVTLQFVIFFLEGKKEKRKIETHH